MKLLSTVIAFAALAAPAFAEGHAASGDAAAGEDAYNRQCASCHIAADADGNVLAGRNGRSGPNLYGIAGGTPGSGDFRYGASLVAYGETGAVWTEENFVAYVMDPTGFLREALDDSRARAKMAYRVRSEEDAVNLYAYLAQFGDM